MTKPRIFLILVTSAAATFALLRGSHQPAQHSPDKLRIVSLAPSVTEILFALDLGDHIVGVTDRCDYPAEARRIEPVGGFGAPNVEKLLALNPDLVIAAGLEREEVAEVLRQSGIRVLDVRIRNFEELFDAIRQIGEAVDRFQQAEGVAARMRAELETVKAQNGTVPRGQRPKVFVEIGDHPLMTAGGTSFLDDLIVRAGGVNVAHEISQAYPSINPEKVIEWNPDIILVTQMGQAGDAAVRTVSTHRMGRHLCRENQESYRRHPSRPALSARPASDRRSEGDGRAPPQAGRQAVDVQSVC